MFNEMAVVLLMMTGLRVGELCDLKLRDLPTCHGKPQIRVRDGKGRVSRSVQVHPFVIEKLAGYIAAVRKGARDGSLLFVTERGGQYDPDYLRSKMEIICKKLGFKKLHPHMLRHTYLTDAWNSTLDLRFVQDQAGHKNINTTAIYTRTSDDKRTEHVSSLRIVKIAQELP